MFYYLPLGHVHLSQTTTYAIAKELPLPQTQRLARSCMTTLVPLSSSCNLVCSCTRTLCGPTQAVSRLDLPCISPLPSSSTNPTLPVHDCVIATKHVAAEVSQVTTQGTKKGSPARFSTVLVQTHDGDTQEGPLNSVCHLLHFST
jgi:hypothetical protein